MRTKIVKLIRKLGYFIKQSFGLYKLIRRFQPDHFKTRRILNGSASRLHRLSESICNHPTTYEDHYWSGGKLKCSVCYKTLKVLWLPKVVYGSAPPTQD